MDKFSERLEQTRENLGINAAKFAEQLDIPYRSYMNYKGGRTPPVELLSKLVDVFGVNPGWLMTGDGEMFIETTEELEGNDDNPPEDTDKLSEETKPLSLPNRADDDSNKQDGSLETRLMKHVLDLHEENSGLRAKIKDLETRLHRERVRNRMYSRK